MANLLPFPPLPAELPRPEPSRPPDAEARASALDIRRSFIVEAPAGSGKTGLLIQRFLKLLADDSVEQPEQLLAITFTLKATAEMRDRVLAHLSAAAQSQAEPEVVFQLVASAAPHLGPVTNDFQSETRALAQAVLARDRLLGWDLLDQPHRLNLRTIDSVCAEIARTLPVLSGSGGRLTPATDAEPLYREAARRTLLLLGSADAALDAALRDLLLHRDGNLTDCESLLADMLSLRDQWGTLIPLTRPQLDDAYLEAKVLPSLQLALEQAIDAELAQLAQLFPADLLSSLAELAAEMSHSEGYKDQLSPIAACQGKSHSPTHNPEDVEHWKSLIHLLIKPSKPRDWRKSVSRNLVKFEIQKHHQARLMAIIARLSEAPGLPEALWRIDSLPSAKYPPDRWAVAKSLFRVLSRALVELQLVFAARNQCDFTELSLLARAALRDKSGPEDLAAALGARLQHLLVDEMQDTSASQYDLIQLLTESWDGHSQTVFLVGDPRQSIYLFRQARVARFLRTLHTGLLGDLPLTRLRLTANFRSQRTLVDHFNENFGLIFPPATTPDTTDALPYAPAAPTLPPSPHASGLKWHTNPIATAGAPPQTDPRLTWEESLTPAQLRQRQAHRDAQQIGRIAARWFAKPLPAARKTIRDESGREFPESWRIAVLVRSRSHLTEIVAAFKDVRNPIPFRAVEIDPLNERQEVLDLTALTRALLHPADRAAWLAVLRAPWCGLPLAGLHTLTGAGDPAFSDRSIQRLMAERGHLLGEESCRRMARVWTVLEAAAAQRARLTTAQLVERAWRSLGGDAPLTQQELTNAQRFFQLLDELEAETPGRIDPARLNARLEKLFAEPLPCPPDRPFVELLTMHKAKGLEWDVVFVPALERSPGFSRARLLTWSELDPTLLDPAAPEDSTAASILLAPIAARGEEVDPLTGWLKRIYREREAAERRRLFYVACTRAREELHLFAAPDLPANGKINPRRDSLLWAAWAAAESHFPAAVDPAPPQGAPSSNPGGLSRESATVLDLAASVIDATEAIAAVGPTLKRLPLNFDPAARLLAARTRRLPYSEAGPSAAPTPFTRPEGSFAARSFGNAVHAFLEVLATRIAAGHSPTTLLAELPGWTPRIAALLRADGLPPATVDRLTRETRAALEKLLRDRDGLWLLAPHPAAASEHALTAWLEERRASIRPASIRIDRFFHAGPEPHAPGEDCLWIVDYKTASHGPSGLDGFLAAQRGLYAPQLETYARILLSAPAAVQPPRRVRLALYYPAIPRLIWWPAADPAHAEMLY